MIDNKSNEHAKRRWNNKAVGSQRSSSKKGTKQYFEEIRNYRYGYETPFIPRLLCSNVKGKSVLELGVGNGIDGSELIKNGAIYSGLDITKNHLELAEKNFILNNLKYKEFIEGDLLLLNINEKYDLIYSFGVLHHIGHEDEYLKRVYQLLTQDGQLRVGLYSKYSFFNIYMFVTWVLRNKCKVPFNHWQGHISDGAEFEYPITIKIRSKKEILKLYQSVGFKVKSYYKRGFVQNYIPIFGKNFNPDGVFLNFMGSVLGWYHIITFEKDSKLND